MAVVSFVNKHIKRAILLSFFAIVVIGTAVAQSKLDAYSRMYLNCHNADATDVARNAIYPKTVRIDDKETVRAIVTLNDRTVCPDLLKYNATFEAQIGDMLIVRVPIDNIVEMSEAEAVRKVQIERPVRLANKNIRVATKQNSVNELTNENGDMMKGKGVVVGVVDVGIDFSHINFKDADGNSRIKFAKSKDAIYTEAEQIDTLTTDDAEKNHGSHTAGTAAGSYTGNGLQGMAPEADLALCGLANNTTTANLLLGCKNIVDYAKSVGKPVVINLSFGDCAGAHDGKDEFCMGVKELAGEGTIFVVSAGNQGSSSIYLNKKFTEDDKTVSTLVADKKNAWNKYNNYYEVFAYSGKLPSIKFFVADIVWNNVIFTTEEYTPTENKLEWRLSDTSSYSEFSNYYINTDTTTMDIYVTTSITESVCSYSIQINGTATATTKYCIGMTLSGEDGEEIHAWGSDGTTVMIDNGDSKFTSGNALKSISSMACTDDVISVGAYTASNSYSALDGVTYTHTNYPVDDIAPFSGYGVDMNGISRPDVCAPGVTVQSSYSTYCPCDISDVVSSETIDGRTYMWGINSGTSMSAPAVTGIIATWLQYKPTLTTAEIREILMETSVKDSYVTTENALKWGAGKIDAYAGLQQIIASGVNDVEVSQNNVLIYPNPNGGQFKVVAQGEYDGAKLNVYNMAGTLVYSEQIYASQDAVDVDLSGLLSSGVYIVSIIGEKVNYSTKMVIGL